MGRKITRREAIIRGTANLDREWADAVAWFRGCVHGSDEDKRLLSRLSIMLRERDSEELRALSPDDLVCVHRLAALAMSETALWWVRRLKRRRKP